MAGNMIIKNASQVVTCSGNKAKFGKDMNELSIIENASVIIENGLIKSVGQTEEILKNIDESKYEIVDASGKCVMPGFVDSHTHFVFYGYREEEFHWRLNGDAYLDILNRGGGIKASVGKTRNASFEEIYKVSEDRLKSMIQFGITTVEGKSGYGLDKDTELKQLRVMKELQKNADYIDLVTTFMGAHATPAEWKGKEDEYIDFIISEVMPEVKKENLAEFCDIFCEKGVFSVEQSRKLLSKAKEMGMKVKIHADEIYQLGGAELAAELGATSADHLLHASDEGLKLMAEKGVIASLLPLTAFCLREDYARARFMIDNGGAVALASDLNPGSCFSNAVPLMFALAVIYMKMTPEEAITAFTINGAAAIGMADKIGSLDEGKQGDVVILKYPSYKYITYNTAMNTVEKVIKKGKVVHENK